MSFLARPIRPLACAVVRRTFVTSRPAFTTGYGRSSGATKGSDSVDPIAGGEVPEYTGPSIAEKKKGGPVQADQAAERLSETRKAEKTINRTGNQVAGGQLKDVRAKRPFTTMTAWRAPQLSREELDAEERRAQQQARYKTPGNLTDLASESMSGSASAAGSTLSESASDLYEKAKKGARSIKDKVTDVMGGDASSTIGEKLSAAGEKLSKASKRVKAKMDDMTEDLSSTVGGGASSVGSNYDGTPRTHIKSSTGGMGVGDPLVEDELPGVRLPASSETARARSSAVPSSIFNGPQEMPQGVGRRAKDEMGQPMETGTKRS